MEAKFAVLEKDGQGFFINCGSPKRAVSLAAAQLDCKKCELEVINAWNLGKPCYFFNAKDAPAEYWLAALKLSGEPCYIGAPAK